MRRAVFIESSVVGESDAGGRPQALDTECSRLGTEDAQCWLAQQARVGAGQLPESHRTVIVPVTRP
jgi:hypothetical protein